MTNKFTYQELRAIWPILTKYVQHCQNSKNPNKNLKIKKKWIDFYSTEDFTLEETIYCIEDYSV